MEITHHYTNSSKSAEELNEIIGNRQKYLPETVEEAISELQDHGHVFPEDELQIINEDIKAQRDNVTIDSQGSSGFFNNNYKYNLVEDPEAPLLYSRRVVYVFTVLFGALFGSIMLAINCNKVKNKNGTLFILLFGIGFTVLQVIGADYINKIGSSYAFFCGLISGICIDRYFWNRFIGNATFYRAKPIWIPLAIGIVLVVLIFSAVIYSSGQ